MSTNHSVGRSTATPKKDRSGLCAFTFADGRQCRTPRSSVHPHRCYYHAKNEAEALIAKQAGEDISSFFSKHYVSACDLSAALARLFRAVARGEIKPKAAMAMAYLGQTLVQALPLAEHEYTESFSTKAWRDAIYSCFHRPSLVPQTAAPTALSSQPPAPSPKPAVPAQPSPAPTPQPTSAETPSPAAIQHPKPSNTDQPS